MRLVCRMEDNLRTNLFLGPGPPAGYLVVVGVPGVEVLAALGQQAPDVLLVMEDEVEITLGRGGVVSPRPLNSHLAEL